MMKDHFVERLYADREEGGTPKSILINMGKVLGILLVTILVTEVLYRAGIGQQSILMLYLLAVLLVSFVTPSYGYGAVAALLYTFSFDYLITVPRFYFSITVGFPITLFTMLLVTFLISTLIIQARKQKELALKRERRAELAYEMNQDLMAAEGDEEVAGLVEEYIERQLGLASVFYIGDPREAEAEVTGFVRASTEDGRVFLSSREERKRAHLVYKTGAEHPKEYLEGAGKAGSHYEAIVSQGRVIGVLGVDCRTIPLTPACHTFLHVLAAQVATVLTLHHLSEERSDLRISAEKEKMRSTLLRSISHDLRTPLTAIIGSGNAILEQNEMPEQQMRGLVEDINSNAQWLIRMVENILTVTRISEKTMAVRKQPEAAEEVVAGAVALVRKRFPDCHIHVRIPDQLLMVPMDATLISQVLINLLENAVKNSEEGALVLLTLKQKGDFARFEVTDHGNGIPERLLENLFEIHTQHGDQVIDASRGIGIGLSICATIVKAHGGGIEGHNREEGGAKFTFTLPLEEAGREQPHEG